MEYKSCFILMPFSKTDQLDKEDLNYIYEYILKIAVEEYQLKGKKYFDRVERYNSKVGSIISGIVNHLNTDDLVIADLTGLNHNVMYELGVRHALRRGTIILSQDLSKLPSDLRDYLTIEYKYSKKTTEQPGNYEIFKAELHKTITEVLSTNKYDSPVLSYLQQKQRFRDEEEVEKLIANSVIIDAICNECYEIEDMLKALEEKNYEGGNNLLTYQLFNWKLNNLIAAFNELKISYNSSILYDAIINSRAILTDLSKIFGMNELFYNANQSPEWPQGIFGTSHIKDCIERPLVNIFALVDREGLKYTNMKELFKDEGILEDELLDYLKEYVEKKAKELGVNAEEINKVLTS